MRALAAALLLLAACRSAGDTASRRIIVTAFGGDVPEPGVTVISHSPEGEVIDQTTADAVGRASVGVDEDSMISVVFPGNLGTLTPKISIVTVPAPERELTVYGPRTSNSPPLIVGVLTVDGPNLNTADYFDIRIGCATVRMPKLPATIDVGACSTGSDTKLDVLVTGYHDLGGVPPAAEIAGYGAGRVPIVDGIATFDVAAWQTGGPQVPLALDGVTPSVQLELFSDGLSYGAQPVVDHATLPAGLVVDSSRVTAALAGIDGASITTREVPGAPAAIALGAADFLPPIAATTSLADSATFSWEPAALGDTANLYATWQVGGGLAPAVPTGPHRVVWNAVLPNDATVAALPHATGELGTAITPTTIVPSDVVLRYVDSPELDNFAALVAAGVHAEDTEQASTIAPRPRDGEIRVSYARGLH